MALFDPAVTKTLRREGGDTLTNDPDDPGGVTRYGIAQRYHRGVDVPNLTLEGAKGIYRREYWVPLLADSLQSQGVAEMLFDAAVNMGVATTVNLARAALGLPATGKMETAMVIALNETPEHAFAAAFTLAKIARYVALCEQTPAKKKYFFGWVRRSLEGVA